MKTLLIHFERFGPYHLARIRAAHHYFREQGWQVVALEIAGNDHTYDWRVETGETVFRRITLFPNAAYDSLDQKILKDKLIETVSALSPDAIAICGYYSLDARALLHWCGELKKTAILMTESTRGDHTRNPLKEIFKACYLKRFSSALCGGIPHRDYLIQLGFSGARIFQGYNAVDNQYFHDQAEVIRAGKILPDPLLSLSGKPYFLASNRFIPRKNLYRLIEAYAQYRIQSPNGWGLLLLGDGPERELLENLTKDQAVPDVIFPGFQQIDQLPAYYAHAGAFIHIPLSEPWGLVVNEAMACGLPLIVSRTTGCARDLCRHGMNGLQVDPDSISEISSAMNMISKNEDLRLSFARESADIIKDYSPEQFALGIWQAVEVGR